VRAIDPSLVGFELEPVEWSWDDRATILYALSIGARLPDELEYLYEQSGPRVAATFPLAATTLQLFPLIDALGLDVRGLLHASQSIALLRVPAPAGRATVTRRIVAVWDKGRAAIIECEDSIDDVDGPLAVARSAWWVPGAGGFGGDRGPSAAPTVAPPDRAPDVTRIFATTTEQAALHRLAGDRNPVHIDPEIAHAAGQPRPFLHGLCTLGALGHALDVATDRRLASLEGRFTRPVFPGDVLTIEAWWDGDDAALARVRVGDDVVLAPARATFA
jgi:acyl dehydratase